MIEAGLVTLFVIMSILWAINIRIKNAAIVDFGWGGGFALLAGLYFVMGDGAMPRKILMLGMAGLWGLRLAGHLLFDRVLADKPEDGRYQEMRKQWRTNIDAKFFLFFHFQTILVVLLAMPFLLMSLNATPEISSLEWIGLLLWAGALMGESVADQQLKTFKNKPENKGKTCRQGLWNYSRHPNYFFEWLVWVAYFIASLGSPFGWITIVCPFIMLWILTKVTGIPITEAQALRSRGDDYREYQRTTSAFVPWFRK
jgi:steroid 5-alpha reductase family enzyme